MKWTKFKSDNKQNLYAIFSNSIGYFFASAIRRDRKTNELWMFGLQIFLSYDITIRYCHTYVCMNDNSVIYGHFKFTFTTRLHCLRLNYLCADIYYLIRSFSLLHCLVRWFCKCSNWIYIYVQIKLVKCFHNMCYL